MDKFFSLPRFDDPETQRRANILVATQIASVIMIIPIVVISAILTPTHYEVLLQGAVGVGFMLGSFYLLKNGKLEISAWIIVVFGWLIMTLDLAFISGIRGVNVLGQVLIVIFAGLAISGKAGLIVTLFSLIANFAILQLESLGIMAAPNPLPTGFTRWFIQAMYTSLAAIYVWRADATISQAIRTSQTTADRYRTLFSHTNDGVIVFNPDWTIYMANPQITGILGYSEDDLIDKNFNPKLITDDRHWIKEIQELALAGKEVPNYEKLLKRKDGVKIPVEISTISVFDSDGNPKHFQCVIRDITGRKAFERQLQYQAEHDHLTDLPNRKYLENRYLSDLKSGEDGNTRVSILYVDLDDFKLVNDTHGHQVGDQLLKEVALRLKSSIRESDTVARIGGDEFIIILENVSDQEAVSKVARKLVDQISQPYQISGNTLSITASIGIQITNRDKLSEVDDFVTSDNAMYQAKTAGKNAFRFIGSEN
jgi:diguanylate cyclase (GGDEF)-like protein/PAS domain S-box-containing protein